MRLVELFDDLFDLFETDPEFRSFHLDGQTIVLDDYLEIRPQNRELLKKYIQDSRLIIGPFTSCRMITSSPARPICAIPFWATWKARSGDRLRRLATIQILLAIWGRLSATASGWYRCGLVWSWVKPVGFDNQVLGDDQFQSTFSEMIWEGQMAVRFWEFYLLTGTAMAMKSQLMRRTRVFWEKNLQMSANTLQPPTIC